MKLPHKLVFHIPQKALVHGVALEIPFSELFPNLVTALYAAGLSGFYVVDGVGFYKGRTYPEKLVTVFCGDTMEAVESAYQDWFQRFNDVLQQEAFAYEVDGELVIKDL